MSPPTSPFKPYADAQKEITGPGDGRPTALQIVKDCDVVGKLGQKTILITGASSGIGVETARALYETGAKLFLTARNMQKLENVIEDIVKNAENKSGPRPVAIEMHLDSLAGVRKGAEEFKREAGGKLNILINNAGVMASPFSKTEDGFELQIGTNHFAHFLLFQLVKPLLLQSAKESGTTSRVINVSSAGHRFRSVRLDDINYTKEPDGYNKWAAYGQSKTANIWMANSITRHYGSQNLLGYSVHPGTIWTELGRHLTQEDIAAITQAQKQLLKSPPQGAATTAWAAVSPHFEGQNSGRYLADVGECGPSSDNDSPGAPVYFPHAYDEEGEERLWNLSCETVGVPQDE